MDFFNFAGIHRPVKLYVTPTVYLLDITLQTTFKNTIGQLEFKSSVAVLKEPEGKEGKEQNSDIDMKYAIYDADGEKKTGLFIYLFACLFVAPSI